VTTKILDRSHIGGAWEGIGEAGRESTEKVEQLALQTRTQFAAAAAEIRSAHRCDSQNCAHVARELAFTGCRIAESAQVD
jgi:hypothetical protein